MTKNPAEIAGTRYKNEKLMSRVQKTDGTSRCFAQIENIKRQSLIYSEIHRLFSDKEFNVCESAIRNKLEIFIPLSTYLEAFDYSEEELKRVLSLRRIFCLDYPMLD